MKPWDLRKVSCDPAWPHWFLADLAVTLIDKNNVVPTKSIQIQDDASF